MIGVNIRISRRGNDVFQLIFYPCLPYTYPILQYLHLNVPKTKVNMFKYLSGRSSAKEAMVYQYDIRVDISDETGTLTSIKLRPELASRYNRII